MIDPREPQVLERSLAQNLKDALMRRLRRIGPTLNPREQGQELLTRHRCKSLRAVDFEICTAIGSPIVRPDGFIFL
jgi:hypothetical protein